MPDATRALELIEQTFPDLDRWQARGARVHLPEPGSELASDDVDWPPFPTTQVAVSGLGLATDHLLAIRHIVQTRHSFVGAEMSLARAALVGSAQAVWVLAPDDQSVRLERSRTIAAEQINNHSRYLSELASLAGGTHDATNQAAGFAEQQSAELKAKRRAESQGRRLNTTEVVEQAALVTFSNEARAAEAKIEWRRSSGVAHGFRWALLGSARTLLVDEGDSGGLGTFAASGGVDRFINLYMCVTYVMSKGWNLLDQRSSACP